MNGLPADFERVRDRLPRPPLAPRVANLDRLEPFEKAAKGENGAKSHTRIRAAGRCRQGRGFTHVVKLS
jgi:hypothetical protein